MLANVNFIGKVLREIVGCESVTFTKLRVLAAFHAIESLRVVQDKLRTLRSLPKQAGDVLAAIATPEVRWLRKRGGLRDVLVHFQAREVPLSHCDRTYQAQLGLLAGGKTQEELGIVADAVLARVSSVLGAGFDLGARAFWYGTVQR